MFYSITIIFITTGSSNIKFLTTKKTQIQTILHVTKEMTNYEQDIHPYNCNEYKCSKQKK